MTKMFGCLLCKEIIEADSELIIKRANKEKAKLVCLDCWSKITFVIPEEPKYNRRNED